jgi:hypothetical protein
MAGSHDRPQLPETFTPGERPPKLQVAERATPAPKPEREIGGRKGPDPVRFGDWEKAGRCIDF